MKKIIGPMILALFFFFSTSLTATAPSKLREITGFGPVTLPSQSKPTASIDVVIRDNWVFNSATPQPRSRINRRPEPIIKNLTPKEPVVDTDSGTGDTVADAKAYALSELGSEQYWCLNKIAIHESHWNPFDLNLTSGAYGIPQALPGSKMAWAGPDWRTNAVTQIKWMIHYVNVRYGSACQAWAFWINNRWY